MSEDKTTYCTATVLVTLRVNLTQPWGSECTLEQVYKQAAREAIEKVQVRNQRLDTEIVGEPKVSVVIASKGST